MLNYSPFVPNQNTWGMRINSGRYPAPPPEYLDWLNPFQKQKSNTTIFHKPCLKKLAQLFSPRKQIIRSQRIRVFPPLNSLPFVSSSCNDDSFARQFFSFGYVNINNKAVSTNRATKMPSKTSLEILVTIQCPIQTPSGTIGAIQAIRHSRWKSNKWI